MYKSLRAQNVDVGTIQANINRVAAKTTEILSTFIEHAVDTVTDGKDIKGQMFQLLGYDLMIDEDLNAWLLEINDHPSLNIYLEKENPDGTTTNTLSLIDLYVKKICFGDTMLLVRHGKQKVSELQ